MPWSCAKACLHGGDQRLVVDRRHVLDRRLPLQATGDQMGDHLGVGGRAEHVALALQALLERLEVLDHAVVDHGQRRRRRPGGDGR